MNQIKNLSRVILSAILLSLLWDIMSILILYNIKFGQLDAGISSNTASPKNMHISQMDFFLQLPLSALFEEVVFRYIPFVILIINAIRKNRLLPSHRSIIIMGIVSSIIFGYLHGNIINVFIQGVGGFILFGVFSNCYYLAVRSHKNGMQSILVALLCSTIVHFLGNTILLSLSMIKTP